MPIELWIVEKGGLGHKLTKDAGGPGPIIAACGKSKWRRVQVIPRRPTKVCKACIRSMDWKKPKPTLAGVEPVEERQLAFNGEWAKLQGDP
jgi:hypothetical protein